MTVDPQVSVLMAVYNGGEFLRAAMSSILSQTFSDFEFVIVDDGSTDDTSTIVASFEDTRVRLLVARHAGLTSALNRGIAACRGRLIARMDADDLALSSRLEEQVSYLQRHPEVDILCSDAAIINKFGRIVGAHRMGIVNAALLVEGLLFRVRAKPIIHPSVMMRRSVAEALGGYREFPCAEDHDFWLRASRRFEFAHIDRQLLKYRVHEEGISRTKRATQAVSGVMSAVNYLVANKSGIDIFEECRDQFNSIAIEARNAVEEKIIVPEQEFRTARQKLREFEFLGGLSAIVSTFCRYGSRVFPWRTRGEFEKLSETLAERIGDDIERQREERYRRLADCAEFVKSSVD